MQYELNISDTHVPFVDQWAWKLTLNIVADVRPACINLGGDMVDFYRLSRFDKDPDRYSNGGLQTELDEFFSMVSDLHTRCGPDAVFRFIPGNHEFRLRSYLMRHSELHGLRNLDLPNLLRLDDLGVEYWADEIPIIPDQLIFTHGSIVRKESAMSAKAEMEKDRFSLNIIHCHTHRKGVYYVTTRNGILTAYENGCLCSLEPEYLVGIPNWQQGCTLVKRWPSGYFHVDDIAYRGQGSGLWAVVDGMVIRP